MSRGITLVLVHAEGKKCLLRLESTLPNKDYLPTNLFGVFLTNSTGWLPKMIKGKAVLWLEPWAGGQETWTSPSPVTSSKTSDDPCSPSGIQCPYL